MKLWILIFNVNIMRKLFTVVMSFVLGLTIVESENMNVKLKNGSVFCYDVDEVDEVYFHPECGAIVEDTSNIGLVGVSQGHQWVDLGLPSGTRWAACNVGAESSTEWGNFYAWADTTVELGNSSTACPSFGLSVKNLIEKGYTDSVGNLKSTYDVARQNWGDGWKLPSKENFLELVNECSWNWMVKDGVEGYEVKSKKEGNKNSIFLPAAGCMDGGDFIDLGVVGRYWTSTAYSSNVYFSWSLYFNEEEGVKMTPLSRRDGISVRPIYQEPAAPIIVDASETPLKFNILTDSTVEVTYLMYKNYEDESIIIPEKVRIDDVVYTVTRIGEFAFHDCYELTNITIPSSVTSIGGGAFYHCHNLSFTIPSSVTYVGSQAVFGCKDVVVDNSYDRIEREREAFCECKSLKFLDDVLDTTVVDELDTPLKFRISPDSTVMAENDESCKSLSSIVVPANVRIEGKVYRVTSVSLDSLENLTSLEIPAGVRAIYGIRFCPNLKKLFLPWSVCEFGEYTFLGSDDLEVVVDNFECMVYMTTCSGCYAKKITYLRE